MTNKKNEQTDLSVVIPCFNEEVNIKGTLETVLSTVEKTGCSYEILVVDDGSSDNTISVVEEFVRTHPELPVSLMKNGKNRGLARTYFDYAKIAKGKYYFLVPGDNCEPQESLLAILERMGEADMILSYHAISERPLFRQIISRGFTICVNILSGFSLKYYNGGNLYPRESVMKYRSRAYGFGFLAEMLTQMLNDGLSYLEVPIRFSERQNSVSTALKPRNILLTSQSLFYIFLHRLRNIKLSNFVNLFSIKAQKSEATVKR